MTRSPLVLQQVTAEHVALAWSSVQELLALAINRAAGEMTLGDVRRRLEADELVLLVGLREWGAAPEAAFVLSTVRYPQCSALRLVLAAGEPMDRWIDELESILVHVCRHAGADRVEFFGRPGFQRILAGRPGWRHQYTVMVREVDT